jgi:hypothetical protein
MRPAFPRILGVAALLAAAACQEQPVTAPARAMPRFDAVAATASLQVPFALDVFIPCVPEDANLSGTLHALLHLTLDAGGGFHGVVHFQPMGVSGVGLTTGLKYQATGVTETTESFASSGAPFDSTSVDNFRIVGQGPGNNVLVHALTHYTVTANGDLTAAVLQASAECK